MSNPAVEVVRSVRKNGWRHTLKLCIGHLENLVFDLRHGTKTTQWIDVEDLDVSSPNRQHAYRYAPTLARPVGRLLKSLDLPRDGVLVDLGCGKGLVLLVALGCGFRRVVGVEFSPGLCQIARRNIAAFKQRHRESGAAEVVETDAATYDVDDEVTVIYVFNPFEPVIWQGVLENVRRSLVRRPRRLWLIYHDPQHAGVIEASGMFGKRTDYGFGPYGFAVYQSEPATVRVLNPAEDRG